MERFQNTGQPDWDWWGKLWPTPGETLREIGLEPGESVVEIGCGNGYFALPAARIVDPGPVYALDLDASLLEELAAVADQQAIESLVPVPGDARSITEHLPEPVDVALIANTFHGIDDKSGFLEDVTSVLAEDGRFIVVNWRPLPRERTTVAGAPRGPPTALRVAPEECRDLVEEAGDFSLAREVDVQPYHYALVFER